MSYTIGEAAAHVGLTAPTLRYYDKEGLLPMVDRNTSGIRVFGETDLAWLKLIECLKATGMPIRDIKQFIDWYMEGDSTLEKRRDMFYERKKAVEEQMAHLAETLRTIEYKCWFYDTAVAAGDGDAPNRLPPEALPEKIRRYRLSQKTHAAP